MCNACGNMCCGSDMFSGCGCEWCAHPACYSGEDDEDYDDAEDGFFCDSPVPAPKPETIG